MLSRVLKPLAAAGALAAALLLPTPASAQTAATTPNPPVYPMGTFGVHVNWSPDGGGIWGGEISAGARASPGFRYEFVLLGMSNFRDTNLLALGVRPLFTLPAYFELGAVGYIDREWTNGTGFGGGYYGAIIGPHLGWHWSLFDIYYEPVYMTNTAFNIARGGEFLPLRLGVGVQF